MNPTIFVNLRIIPFSVEDLDFLSHQNLQPEYYFTGKDIDETSENVMTQILEESRKRRFSPIFHSPFYDLNLGAADHKIRAVSEGRVLWALDTAKSFEASQVVVHPGYGANANLGEESFTHWLERAKESISKIVAKADDLRIKIAFENIYDSHPENLCSLIELYPKEVVGVCFDTGHFNLFSETPMKAWLSAFGERTFEVHLHDNSGDADEHIAIGDGTVKFEIVKNWLAQQAKLPKLTIEMRQKTHVVKSIGKLKSWFRPSMLS